MAAVLGLKDLPPPHLQNTPGSPLAVELGGGLLQPSDCEMSFGCLPSSTAIRTCCQEVIPGDFISILQLASLGFAGPSGGAVQAACRQGAHRASRIPQRRARTGSSKLRCCRRNRPNRHFRGGRSPCRDTPAVPWGCCTLRQEGGGGMGRTGGSPRVGSGGHTQGPARQQGLRGAQLCRWQQPGAAGPGRLMGLRGSTALECGLAPGQGRGAVGQARASPI